MARAKEAVSKKTGKTFTVKPKTDFYPANKTRGTKYV